jgi:CRP-like cAMP-binding protein/putative methionine-R-sulfoxide reductase with GAF domain/two-component sensor histidine kinase
MRKPRTKSRARSTPSARHQTRVKRQQKPDQRTPLLEWMQRNILFGNVDPKVLGRIAPRLSLQTVKAGEMIFDESSRGRELYLLCQGRVKIEKYTKFGVDSLLAVLHEGDFFGELSLLDGLPRSARADALDECTIVSLNLPEVRWLLEQSPQFASNLLTNLAIRLRTMDQTYVVELDRNALALKGKLDRLNKLIEASKIVNSAIDIDRLLGLILDVAVRGTGADRGTLYLADESSNELWSKVAQGRNNMVEIRLPFGRGLAGYVAKTGETVNIADAYKDPRFNPEIDKRSGYKTHNVLCMPMRNKDGKIAGVFQLLNKHEGSFGLDDEAFIDGLSVHAAIALENARMAKEMVQSERLSAVGRMASTIIHDIKNPMATLRIYAQVIQKKSPTEESAQLAEEIIRQVDRFVSMTQEVLDFSRGVSEIKTEEVVLGEVLESMLAFVDRDLGKRNVAIVRQFDYTDTCLMDIDKVVRIFYNIAANAADAMKDGGTLTVRSVKKDDNVLIEFSDTGCGIPDEIRHRVFEPFFTHGKRHGTGLGLAIVKKIMEDHHGTVQLESEEGKGTTVRLCFPIHRL